ncbi:MAG: hypothetical protein ABI627_27520 [Polyangiaceae bacterium]
MMPRECAPIADFAADSEFGDSVVDDSAMHCEAGATAAEARS